MEMTKNIVDMIVALATVFSLIVIWQTLREMKTQRHKAFEPYVLPLNFEILLLCEYPRVILPIYTYLSIEEIKNKQSCADTFIQLRNIGQGVAKDISVKVDWDMRYRKYFEIVKSELIDQNVDLDINISDNSCWISTDEERHIFSGGNFPFENNYHRDFDYLLPVRDNNDEMKIEVPSSLKCMLELSILLLECLPDRDREKAYNRLKDYFHPKIEIFYRDNLGNPFTSSYKMIIKTIKIKMQSNVTGKMYTLGIERLK
jgi:hypothetical protein